LKVHPESKVVALLSPRSIPSEQYRTLKARLCQLRSQARLKSMVVTSAGMADGKTTTAVNLAVTLAHEIGAKILLVDGDLRRPKLHSKLGVPQAPGLVDYLNERERMENIIRHTDFQGLYLVPAGIAPEQPAELLNSKHMTSFLQDAAEEFDWVIVDSPPVAALADAELLASKVDGVLFVVRAMQTPMDLLANAMDCLKDRRLLGIVLNCHEDFKMTKYSSYYNYEQEAGIQ
jgi:capsular exopolysaccharide synthesis family protein